MELIHYPPDAGNPIWQQRSAPLFLGIDHFAIAVADTERSIDFYTRLLGFNSALRAVNTGSEQARLDCARNVRVGIVALQPASVAPPRVEFLDHEKPVGRPIPADLKANDMAVDCLILQVHGLPCILDSLYA